MKRNIKRLLLFLLLAAVAFSVFAVAVSAEELKDGEKEVIEENGTEKNGFFDSVYKVLVNNSEEIFSLLAFLGTLTVAFAYKKGLLPGVTKVTGIISDALETIGKESKKTSEETAAQAEKLERFASSLSELSERLSELYERLESDENKSERKKLGCIMEGQIDLLCDIFMSSSLPQYKKDEVGTRVAKMKEALKENEAAVQE